LFYAQVGIKLMDNNKQNGGALLTPEMVALEQLLRAGIPGAKRILIKVGTSVVTQKNHTAALGRISCIVEQIVELKENDKQIILVTSGAVGLGSKVMIDRPAMGPTHHYTSVTANNPAVQKRASAAIGQARLMALYDILFAHKNISVSQILLKNKDLLEPNIMHLAETCNFLLKLGVVPILNENDVTNIDEQQGKIVKSDEKPLLSDNDSLACHLASHIGVDLVILLTDVDGVYTAPPSTPGARVIPLIDSVVGTNATTTGSVSGLGRGGMQAKIQAAGRALNSARVPVIIIANGFHQNTILRVTRGESIGTLIVKVQDELRAKL